MYQMQKFTRNLRERLLAVAKERTAMTTKARDLLRQQGMSYGEIMSAEWYMLPEAQKYLNTAEEPGAMPSNNSVYHQPRTLELQSNIREDVGSRLQLHQQVSPSLPFSPSPSLPSLPPSSPSPPSLLPLPCPPHPSSLPPSSLFLSSLDIGSCVGTHCACTI